MDLSSILHDFLRNLPDKLNFEDSDLLQNFVTSEKISLKIISGNIYSLVKKSSGISLLFSILLRSTKPTNFIDMILVEIFNDKHIFEIAITPSISYFTQKILEKCNSEQLLQVVNIAYVYIYDLCFDEYGARFIQRLIEKVSGLSPHARIVMDALKTGGKTGFLEESACIPKKSVVDYLVPLFLNEKSKHIIKKIFIFHKSLCSFLYPPLFNSFSLVWGCRAGSFLLQQCMDLFDSDNQGMTFFFFRKRKIMI
jgi:hypothetical protein